MADRFVQQDARPARTQHDRHRARRCRLCFELHSRLSNCLAREFHRDVAVEEVLVDHDFVYRATVFVGHVGEAEGDVDFVDVLAQMGCAVDKGTDAKVVIANQDSTVFEGTMPYVNTFGDVPQGEPLLYMNSVNNLSAAINWGDFAGTHGIASGPEWRIEVGPAN